MSDPTNTGKSERRPRIGRKQKEILGVIADCCYVDEEYGQIKCAISNSLFGWPVFDTYSERERFFKNLERRGFIELHKGQQFAVITNLGREAIKEPS
jgi:hypothetical protein